MASTADLDALVRTRVTDPIPAETLFPILSTAPFVPSKSLINARDIGAVPGSNIPAGRIFRCGTLQYASQDPDALAWIGANVRRIFDLRKPDEVERGPDPEIAGVENVWRAAAKDYQTPSLAEFAKGDGSEAWRNQYLAVALSYAPTYKAVLEHIRDTPTEPFLFHCTAGRDRTGVLAGLLHHLAGTASDDAVRDYMLSRIGTEVARDKLIHFALESVGTTDMETPGFYNLVELRPQYWNAFVDGLTERYGGWDGYVTKELGLSEEDLNTVKKNIRS
ncbi:uncharacterized protein TrAtP1_003234 [Trichoderma atroviride]|uniref:Tyrosine specific protein phosphatases domain-containing protein n=1 Tax=Hypocrea atroviridis (strain ATCC 20476 / IMI 206040) TaxID=452589 RepID=G9NVK8_HYPAI|nr:uncharacterized protein TRIATDRAFT_299784 [Trichoderma atroviride IMI 206040]EHK45027.1 hypothetical protein TRIATDRAFT_299784 [Trichoderma atroviride IMI 206040]UKZ61973.1 hypothetical protein TrAtP1_003234 [Trichoderma atroviride]